MARKHDDEEEGHKHAGPQAHDPHGKQATGGNPTPTPGPTPVPPGPPPPNPDPMAQPPDHNPGTMPANMPLPPQEEGPRYATEEMQHGIPEVQYGPLAEQHLEQERARVEQRKAEESHVAEHKHDAQGKATPPKPPERK